MVTLISRHMYGKKSLIKGFNGTDFDDDFNFILNDVYHNYKEIVNSNKKNSLDFQGFITQLKTINGNLLIGTGNIEIATSTPVDLSNYALKDHTHDAYALK